MCFKVCMFQCFLCRCIFHRCASATVCGTMREKERVPADSRGGGEYVCFCALLWRLQWSDCVCVFCTLRATALWCLTPNTCQQEQVDSEVKTAIRSTAKAGQRMWKVLLKAQWLAIPDTAANDPFWWWACLSGLFIVYMWCDGGEWGKRGAFVSMSNKYAKRVYQKLFMNFKLAILKVNVFLLSRGNKGIQNPGLSRSNLAATEARSLHLRLG